jgi:hypothetical protein
VLRGSDGQIVGFLGNIPRLFRVVGTDARVYCATTWRVLPEFRNRSVALYAEHLKAGARTFLFNTTPNESVVKLLDYLKYQSIPTSRSGRAYLLPINASKVAKAYLGRAGSASIVSGLAAFMLKGAALTPNAVLSLRRDGRVRIIDDATMPFNALWNRTRDTVPYTSVRNAEQIDWMCFASPARRKTVLGFVDDQGLKGYAIFRDSEWRGLRVLEAFDLWPANADDGVVSALLTGARDHAGNLGYDLVTFHDYSNRLTKLLRRAGMLLTSTNRRRQYFRAPAPHSKSMTPADTYLTGIDGDGGL